jgi:hypothetical protein
MSNSRKEWSRYYHDSGITGLEALHARFVGHRYPRHAHDYSVIALVESGAASYWYRGAQHVAPAGHVFVVNPGEPHAGELAKPEGYFYKTIYPRPHYLARVAEDVGGRMVLRKEPHRLIQRKRAMLDLRPRKLTKNDFPLLAPALQCLARPCTSFDMTRQQSRHA